MLLELIPHATDRAGMGRGSGAGGEVCSETKHAEAALTTAAPTPKVIRVPWKDQGCGYRGVEGKVPGQRQEDGREKSLGSACLHGCSYFKFYKLIFIFILFIFIYLKGRVRERQTDSGGCRERERKRGERSSIH